MDGGVTTDHEIRMILEWEIHRLGSVEGMAHHWRLLPAQVRAVLAGAPVPAWMRRALDIR